MCAGTVEIVDVEGSGKNGSGWFPIHRARAVYDHAFHAPTEDALILDFVNPDRGPSARISVELSADSAKNLVKIIERALKKGEAQHSR